MSSNPRIHLRLFCALATFFCGHSVAADRKPNIIVIMADNLGWRDLRCYGNAQLDTPAIDQLAAEGVRFTDGYAAAPVCTPTRAAMMTGQSPARLHITNHAPGNAVGFALKDSPWHEAETSRHLPLAEMRTLAPEDMKALVMPKETKE